MLGVRSDAQAVRDDLERTRDELDADSFLDGDVVDALRGYADRMDGLTRRLDNPFLMPARLLPVVGRQVSAARHQSDASASALQAAVTTGEDLRVLVDGGLRSGPQRVETLRQVNEVAQEGRQRFARLDLGPDQALVAPLASARDELEEAQVEVIDALDRLAVTSSGLAELFEGPADYLLFAANTAQMQNGQGMFLSAGVLHVEGGRMDLGPMESLESTPTPSPRVPLEPDLAARWGWLDPNDDLRHLGLSARFPVTGDTASQLWTALGRPAVDGVMAVDPQMLATIMRATGPVATSGRELATGDVVRFALHDQYQGYLSDGEDTSYTERRRDELDEIASVVMEEFEQVDTVRGDFLDRFRRAASGRHLLMWSSDREVQAAFEAAGVDGQIGPESLLLSLVNRSGNKLDWFMRTSADLSVERADDGSRDVVVDVTISNEAPDTGEPRYVVGPYPGSGLQRGEYLGLVTLNLPEAATDSRVEGVDRLAVSGADGPNRTIAAWVRVAPGGTTRLVAKFRLPASATGLRIEPSARAYPTSWSFDGRTWEDSAARSVAL